MSRIEKLIQSMINNPKNVDFEELKKLLEDNGYEATNTGGSHFVFRKEGKSMITIPRKKPVKAIYVKKVIEELGLINDKK